MAFVETKLALEAGTAAINLISSLIGLIEKAKEQDDGGANQSIAEILAKLPAEAIKLSKELLSRAEYAKQLFIDTGIPLDKSISDLEKDYWFWFSDSYKIVREIHAYSNALCTSIGHAIDDFIAIAKCGGQLELVSGAFAESREKQNMIDGIVKRDIPIGEILDQMISFARQLRNDVQELAS